MSPEERSAVAARQLPGGALAELVFARSVRSAETTIPRATPGVLANVEGPR